tara:strand:- start:4753 stop:5712 length:960 start_codon:yes stop_codon:yes gene_type:complete
MGGPRVNKNNLRNLIMTQPNAFTQEDIAIQAGTSQATVSNILKTMVPHQVQMAYTRNRKRYYGVVGVSVGTEATSTNEGNTPHVTPHVRSNILDLPVKERFKYVELITKMVATKISPSALITGLGGIGKTYTVLNTLESLGMVEGIDYIMIKGKATPGGLYETLATHQNQLIVFDDCDSIFRVEDSRNILKGALDSYSKRIINWRSSKGDLPDQIEFEGSIIFVSNINADTLDDPLKSRTMVVDLQMTRPEICDRIEQIMENIDENLSMDEKKVVIGGLREHSDQFENFNVRTFLKACRIYRIAEQEGQDWTRMIKTII